MKAKVQALSMEAKASAAIIGSLPFIVGLLVYYDVAAIYSCRFSPTRAAI